MLVHLLWFSVLTFAMTKPRFRGIAAAAGAIATAAFLFALCLLGFVGVIYGIATA